MSQLFPKKIFFNGIKGVGMTALALCLQDLGCQVSGTDTDETFPTDPVLNQRQIKVKVGFDPKLLVKDCQLVIYTGAHHGIDNPLVKVAINQKIPTLNYAQALAKLTKDQDLIVTAGVGGKSTIAAMLATTLTLSHQQTSYLVGAGAISPLGVPGKVSRQARFFVCESDEFVADPGHDLTPKFHYLHPRVIVLPNFSHDHPDIYPKLEDCQASFLKFFDQLNQSGTIITCIDQPSTRELLKKTSQPVITYGFSPQADWQIVDHHLSAQKQFFTLKHLNTTYPAVALSLPGDYNLLNATAALVVGHFLGLDFHSTSQALSQYQGTKRRFELIFQNQDFQLYDDYAHHPNELVALLKAARSWLPDRQLAVIFQSHTYSRTKKLLDQFATSFQSADLVLINQIFSSARETDTLNISGQTLTQAISQHQSNVYYTPFKTETIKALKQHLKKPAAIFTVGAGNNWLWHQDIIKLFKTL